MLLLAGDEDGAIDAWTRGIDVARTQSASGSTSNAMPFYSLILLQHSRGVDVHDLLREAVGLFPGHLALRWVACKHAIERDHSENVRDQLEELASIDPDSFHDPELSYDKSLFAYASRDCLALCHFRAGRFREAAEWYRRAAAAAPDTQANEIRAQLASAKALARRKG
jgi:tetratricopeptide (TPR) repeat protein